MPRDSRCPFPGNKSIDLAVFKVTTVKREFSKCHSRLRCVHFLEEYPTGFYEAMTVAKDFLKCHTDFSKCHTDFSKCHAAADDATSWNSIYYSHRSNLAIEIHFLEFLWIWSNESEFWNYFCIIVRLWIENLFSQSMYLRAYIHAYVVGHAQECHAESRYTTGIGHMCISLSDTFRYARLR